MNFIKKQTLVISVLSQNQWRRLEVCKPRREWFSSPGRLKVMEANLAVA
ncbi:hypothetical protein KKD19_05935 [Patescibacteria group bacterium]|nr:hypothetical protein [Patescibacteria group bacterium]MBU4512744.1 hypothetical protein [Patescibacteria group bacterium]MCG2693084.1 hypothetical protein [Candidatus Parcubacteria bacterium]